MKDVLTADGKTVVFIISFMNINFFHTDKFFAYCFTY